MSAKSARGSGRPAVGAAVLQAHVTTAIIRALFREWAKTGYAALSLEAVARRAGVGKAAIYRRWPSKLEMVTQLLTEMGIDLAEVPDTGTLGGDVRGFLERTQALLRRPTVRRILPDLHAEVRRTPGLAAAVRSRMQRGRRTQGLVILRRAISRGELSTELDLDLAIDLIASPIYWRTIVTAQPAPPGYLERLTAMTLGGLRALSEQALETPPR